MTRRLKLLVLALSWLPVGLVASVPAAVAFVQEQADNGAGLHWRVNEVHYRINENGSADIDDGSDFTAVKVSFDTWQAIDCLPLTFMYLGPTDDTRVGFDESAGVGRDCLVIWRERPGEWSQAGHSGSVLALTSVTYERDTGVIVDADIELNGVDHSFATDGDLNRWDIQNTVTHEVGHLLGLGHSRDPEATMFATAREGETKKRELSEDDIAGICFIYRHDGAYADLADGGCSKSAGSSRGRSGAVALLLFVLLGLICGARLRRAVGPVALGVLLGSSLLAGPVFAFELFYTEDGVPLRWYAEVIPFATDSKGVEGCPPEAALEVVEASFETWQNARCADFVFDSQGLVSGLQPSSFPSDESPPAVLFVQEGWRHGSGIVGLTTLVYGTTTGEIVDADLELNNQGFKLTIDGCSESTAWDVQNVLTHEVGHLLGLDHSSVEEAVMFEKSEVGETTKRTLHENDHLAICALYGSPDTGGNDDVWSELDAVRGGDASPTAPDPKSGSCAVSAGGGAGIVALWLLAAAIFLATGRVRGQSNRDRAGPTITI